MEPKNIYMGIQEVEKGSEKVNVHVTECEITKEKKNKA